MHWSNDVSVLFEPLRELARHSPDSAVRSVMTDGVPELETAEYDNWNGGSTYYTLLIRVPVPVYATVEGDLEKVEEEIKKKVERYTRSETHDFISSVQIQPAALEAIRSVPPAECKFWTAGYFRLFVSHVSKNKRSANLLKTFLQPYGITTFVAHDDIELTKEWPEELEKALLSMEAMVAILAPGFQQSDWCDQEV